MIEPRSVCVVCSGLILTGQPRMKGLGGDFHLYCRVRSQINRKRPEEIEAEREARMRAVYERDQKLRASADIVVEYGQPRPRWVPAGKTVYVESETAAMLRRRYGSIS